MNKVSPFTQPSLAADANLLSIMQALDYPFDNLSQMVANVLIYPRIDTLPEEIVDRLAFQFHLESYKLAVTLDEKREMVKKAIELHRYKGTPWAVKESLKAAGYKDAVLIEYGQILRNGEYKRNGTIQRYAFDPYQFRVLLDLGNYKGIDESLTQDIIRCINDYKNARSHLLGLRFKANLDETAYAGNDFISLLTTYKHRRNGTYKRNGLINRSGQHTLQESI